MDDESLQLTPLRAHYLKKSLFQLQLTKELELITTEPPSNASTLSYLGPPFAPPPKDAPPLDLPFLKYLFRQYVLTFPFMAAAPKDFYSQKLQPFVNAVLARNLTPQSALDDGASEMATRKKLLAKLERNLSLFLGNATKITEAEEIVRLNQSDLDRLQVLSEKRRKRLAKQRDTFDVNIVGVRTVVEKGRMRSRAHQEFIIRTRRSQYPDVYVSRRYGDFKTLATELSKAHPEESIKPPPPKDRSTAVVMAMSPSASSPPPKSPVPLSRQSTAESFDAYDPDISTGPQTSRLPREKNRLTLRSYLHSLLGSSVGSSPVIRSFLLAGQITLTADEKDDARRREEADRVREDGRKRFAREIAARVDGLRGAVRSVKGDIMSKDGLTHIFATIKETPDIHLLPDNYQSIVEWARISLASTIFQMYVASDDSSDTFAGLKRIHALMPYFMLKTALKVTNPVSMIRNVLDLFLATPFGGRSLLQRMFTSSLTEDVRLIEEDIEAVKEKVDDPMMCEKVKQFVYAPKDIQALFKLDAEAEKMNIVTVILRSAEEPVLSKPQMQRLARAHRAHMLYLKHKESLQDSDDDDGPEDEDAWLLEDLKVLIHLYSKLKDRQQLIELVFEGFTSELLKDIITIFYSPLAQVYKAANITDSVSDVQNFINDLIRTVESVEQLSSEDPQATVHAFISLVQRHEHSFYHFVHKVHSKGEGLFGSLMHWIELFLTVVREGIGDPISLEYLLPFGGQERADIMAEVDKVALYHYKLKVLYEEKLRRRFGRLHGDNVHADADAEDMATQELVNSVVSDFNFGELVSADAVDVAAEDSDGEDSTSSESYSSTEYETDSDGSDATFESARSTPLSPTNPPRNKKTLHNAHDHRERQPPTASQSQVQAHRSATHRSTASSSVVSPSSSSPAPAPQRKRSHSLRAVRSMTSSLRGFSLSRNNQDASQSIPPVPPLPSRSQTLGLAQANPIPPTPPIATRAASTAAVPPAEILPLQDLPTPGPEPQHPDSQPAAKQQGGHGQSQPAVPTSAVTGLKTKKLKSAIQPPNLQYIPNLLPVFVEQMKPALRVRKLAQ